MKVKPIASDSMGVRSMATYIETKHCKILIDPSAALGQKRYGLNPHQKEIKALSMIKSTINKIAEKCDILTISHYHFDHFEQDEMFYRGKKVFAKDIFQKINNSQKQRGSDLKNKIEKKCDLIYCDNTEYKIKDTIIKFSPPFFHGPENIKLGYVIMTTIDDGKKRIIHTSDVQGPVEEKPTNYIIEQKPDILILDGPPTMMLGFRFSKKNLEKATKNLCQIIKKTKCEIILDHHLLRDLKYNKNFLRPYEYGKDRVKTFAEYLGKENNTLEAHRKILWGK